jgi:hypothetical protein
MIRQYTEIVESRASVEEIAKRLATCERILLAIANKLEIDMDALTIGDVADHMSESGAGDTADQASESGAGEHVGSSDFGSSEDEIIIRRKKKTAHPRSPDEDKAQPPPPPQPTKKVKASRKTANNMPSPPRTEPCSCVLWGRHDRFNFLIHTIARFHTNNN